VTESGSLVVWAGWETRSVRTGRRCHAGSEPELRGIVCVRRMLSMLVVTNNGSQYGYYVRSSGSMQYPYC
jgi:hypothetical protein